MDKLRTIFRVYFYITDKKVSDSVVNDLSCNQKDLQV